jgi:predicted short-subunit dehydrogenase-like oxidoreductase (DUF2520 family)
VSLNHHICIIGAGSMGTNLALNLAQRGHKPKQIISRTISSASMLSHRLGGVDFATALTDLDPRTTTAFITTSDNAIAEVVEELSKKSHGAHTTFLHGAGGVPLTTLHPLGENIGVFYPFMTFNTSRYIDLSQIPIFCESTPASHTNIEAVCRLLHCQPQYLPSDMRNKIHLAGVFASNFINYMLLMATEIIRTVPDVDYKVLFPLVEEVIEKVKSIPPADAQTGPARRHDTLTIDRHINLLRSEYPHLVQTYEQLSMMIAKSFV